MTYEPIKYLSPKRGKIITFEELSELKHTPFASRYGGRGGLVDYGFHVFIGRELFDEGYEFFVTLDALGAVSYATLGTSIDDLFRAVQDGRKVLLAKSPGSWECPPNVPQVDSRTYVPFDESTMRILQEKFEANPDMKCFENPFNYQPK